MKSNMDYQTCLTTMQNLYFFNGRSLKGRLPTMENKLGSNKGEVTCENFSTYQVARSAGRKILTLYLLTKKRFPSQSLKQNLNQRKRNCHQIHLVNFLGMHISKINHHNKSPLYSETYIILDTYHQQLPPADRLGRFQVHPVERLWCTQAHQLYVVME